MTQSNKHKIDCFCNLQECSITKDDAFTLNSVFLCINIVRVCVCIVQDADATFLFLYINISCL